MKRLLFASALLLTLSIGLQACGGDDDNKGGDGDPENATATARADCPTCFAVPDRTKAAGTPGTPAGGTPGVSATQAPAATLSPEEATRVAGDITGGGPDSTPEVVSTIPAVDPPAGTTPVVDPTEIAPPQIDAGDLRLVVDMNASQPGIQSSRDVNPGDTFKVAIIVSNVPPPQGTTGGLAAFNFVLNYDKTKIVAPTIAGGPATERNPDLNTAGLGGDAIGWDCLPAPEGDMDDPGGINGDGDPATGQAILSCFTPGTGKESGDLVLATVTFTAIASGSSKLSLSTVEIGDEIGISYAHCPADNLEPEVPCIEGDLNVR